MIEAEIQLVRGDIERVIERVSSLYLKTKRSEKTLLYSDHSNDQSPQTSSHPNSYTASHSNNFGTTNHNNFTSSVGTGPYNFLYHTAPGFKDQLQKESSTKESSK